jgi:HK97 family phage portal protein
MDTRIGFIARLKRAYLAYTLTDLDRDMGQALGGRPTFTGVDVSENSALNYTAVYACVRVRAEALSSLSLHLYRRDGERTERATEHRLYRMLHDAPNDEMTAVELLETAQAHLDTWGNAYLWLDVPKIGRNAGYVQGIYPLKPDRVSPKRVHGRLQYDYRRQRDDGSEETVTYDVSQVLHVPALGYDGIMGYSPVGMARQAIGMGLALEEFGARYFGQGTHPAGVMTNVALPPGTSLDAFNAYLREQYQGLGKAHSIMTVTGDAKYQPLTMPLEDAQFLSTRKFQLAEIARIYRVPLHLIAELDKATFSNIEMQALEFAMFTIMPLAKKWEKKLNLRLLTEREREQGYFFEFDLNSLMRGDNKSRGEFYRLMREVGAMSPNEIRERENLDPREGGDDFWDQGPSGQGIAAEAKTGSEPAE